MNHISAMWQRPILSLVIAGMAALPACARKEPPRAKQGLAKGSPPKPGTAVVATPAAAAGAGREMSLIPAGSGSQVMPSGWEFRFLDWSSNAPTPIMGYGKGSIRFHFTSAGPGPEAGPLRGEWPVKALLTYSGKIAPGRYRIQGRIKAGGNNGLVQLRTKDYRVLTEVGSAGGDRFKTFSEPILIGHHSGPDPFDFRMTGDGAYWIEIADLRLIPEA